MFFANLLIISLLCKNKLSISAHPPIAIILLLSECSAGSDNFSMLSMPARTAFLLRMDSKRPPWSVSSQTGICLHNVL